MKKSRRYIIGVVVLAAALGFIIAQQSETSNSISAEETYKILKDTSIVILDVRTEAEHISERIAETPLIPVQELEERIQEMDKYKKKKIIIYCRSGNRSGRATSILREHGFNAVNMTGGILSWKASHLPTINGATQ